jgi:NAD(P)-dependent dehydrogenase (short-subunit alcohol dehydrogenase family)
VVAFLCSDDASFVTAADIAVDGGYRGMGGEGLGDVSEFAGSH